MHWRAGFRRLAVAGGLTYWTLAGLVLTLDFPSQVVIARNHDSAKPLLDAVGTTFSHLTIWAIVFVGLVIAYRGARWIARGFLDGEASSER